MAPRPDRMGMWTPTRLLEQAVSRPMHGPTRPSEYDTRPTMKLSPLPVELAADTCTCRRLPMSLTHRVAAMFAGRLSLAEATLRAERRTKTCAVERHAVVC